MCTVAGEAGARASNLDSRPDEGGDQFSRASRITSRHYHHPLHAPGASFRHRALPERQVVSHPLRPVLRGGLDGGERADVMLRDAIAKGEYRSVVATPADALPTAAIGLVSHAGGARQTGPGIPVEGTVQIEFVPHVVQPPVPVEGIGIAAAKGRQPLGRFGAEVLVHRTRSRRKEIVRRLAMLVYRDHWVPSEHGAHQRLCLPLRGCHHVAIEVEPVVVETPLYAPRLPVLHRSWVRVRHIHRVVPHREPLMAVRIGRRVEDHQRVTQRVDGCRLLAGSQLIQRLHCGLESGRLVAVHRLVDPYDYRHAVHDRGELGCGHRSRIGDPVEIGADLLQPRDVFRRRNEEQAHRPPLVAAADLVYPHTVRRGLGYCQQRSLLRGILGVHRANVVPEYGLRSWHVRPVWAPVVERERAIVADPIPRRGLGGHWRCQRQNEERQRHQAADEVARHVIEAGGKVFQVVGPAGKVCGRAGRRNRAMSAKADAPPPAFMEGNPSGLERVSS